jgi:aspartate kinase
MVSIIKAAEQQEPKVVLSAFKGTTDQLLKQANSAKDGSFSIDSIEAKHHELLDDLSSTVRRSTELQVDGLLKELREILTGVTYLRELTPTVLDKIFAYGEKLAIHVAAGYMAEEKLKGVPLSDTEAGIMTNSNFGNATILDQSCSMVKEKLVKVHIPLIAGFFGKDAEGRIATLGRGATDYVAAFIAAAFGCKTVLYKDVDGVMTADPKLVPLARLIPNLDYASAIELGRYGSKVVFEKAVIPAMRAGTTIEVTRFEEEKKGTLISSNGVGEATSYIKGMAIVQISRIHGLNIVGAILSEIDRYYSNDPIIVAPLFADGISLVTKDESEEQFAQLARRIGGDVDVRVRNGLSLVALVGRRFEQPQIYEALKKAGVEPTFVLKSPSGMTTCALVDQEQTDASVRALHSIAVLT